MVFCHTGKTADALLTDLNGYEELKKNIKEFSEELDEYHTDQFDSWSREMLHMIDNEELRYSNVFMKSKLLKTDI